MVSQNCLELYQTECVDALKLYLSEMIRDSLQLFQNYLLQQPVSFSISLIVLDKKTLWVTRCDFVACGYVISEIPNETMRVTSFEVWCEAQMVTSDQVQ